MQRLLFLIPLFLMVGCLHDESPDAGNILQGDLSGTWLFTSERMTRDSATNTLLSSDVFTETNLILESTSGIELRRCFRHHLAPLGAIPLTKTNQTLTFSTETSDPFFLGPNQLLERDVNVAGALPGQTISAHETLKRVSTAILLDSGDFVLNGPVSINESDHVCVAQTVSAANDLFHYQLWVPHDNDALSLTLSFSAPPAFGNYQYIQGSSSGVLFSFDVGSNSNAFWTIVGTNGLFPNTADLTLTTANSTLIEGSFSFIGHNGGNYTGQFSFAPHAVAP